MSDNKFKLLESDKPGLYRIQALRNFSDVLKGDIGGYVEKEKNLSQEGDCWIYDNAKVIGNAVLKDNATAQNNSIICDNAVVSHYATVCDEAVVNGDAKVYGSAVISRRGVVGARAEVYERSMIGGRAYITDGAKVYGKAIIEGSSTIAGMAEIYGYACVTGNSIVTDSAKIHGDVNIDGPASIMGDAEITEDRDFIVFKNWWSSGRYFTWTRSNNMYKVGCFYGTGEELIKKAYDDTQESGEEYERIVKYVNDVTKHMKTTTPLPSDIITELLFEI